MIVGDSPDDVQAIQIGNAAPSENGRGYDLSLEVTFSVVALPIAPAVLF
jgi:hypothetical protein